MEKENNAPKTQQKPTTKDKMQIICQYANQLLECSFLDAGQEEITARGEIVNMTSPNVLNASVGVDDYDFYLESDNVVILLKPLENISEEDKFSIADIMKISRPKELGGLHSDDVLPFITNCINKYISRKLGIDLHIADFLRERGYALPYKNWSVDQLVEFGIYKLID